MHSLNLARYLQHRADGDTVERASELSGIGLGEAKLHEKDIERGELVLPRARAREDRTNFPAKNIPENIPEGEKTVARDTETTVQIGDGPKVPLDDFVKAGKQAQAATDTGQRLRLYIERVERLDGEIKDLNSDKSDLFKEIKSDGFDTKTIKRIIKLRKMDSHTRQEAEALLSTYMNAIGMTPIEEAIALAAAA